MEQRRDLFCCSIRTAWRDMWKELHAEANLYHQRGGAARAERDKEMLVEAGRHGGHALGITKGT